MIYIHFIFEDIPRAAGDNNYEAKIRKQVAEVLRVAGFGEFHEDKENRGRYLNEHITKIDDVTGIIGGVDLLVVSITYETSYPLEQGEITKLIDEGLPEIRKSIEGLNVHFNFNIEIT